MLKAVAHIACCGRDVLAVKSRLDKFPAERRLAALRAKAFPTLVGAHQRAIDHDLVAALLIGAYLDNSLCDPAGICTAIMCLFLTYHVYLKEQLFPFIF